MTDLYLSEGYCKKWTQKTRRDSIFTLIMALHNALSFTVHSSFILVYNYPDALTSIHSQKLGKKVIWFLTLSLLPSICSWVLRFPSYHSSLNNRGMSAVFFWFWVFFTLFFLFFFKNHLFLLAPFIDEFKDFVHTRWFLILSTNSLLALMYSLYSQHPSVEAHFYPFESRLFLCHSSF